MEAPVLTPAPEPTVQKNNPARAAGIFSISGAFLTVFGLVLGIALPETLIVAPLFCGTGVLMGVVGLILGIIALTRISKDPGQTGKGLAITAIILGALAILSLCLMPFLGLVLLGLAIGDIFSEVNSNLAP